MKKKIYEQPVAEINVVEVNDIIMNSPGMEEDIDDEE